MTNPSLAKGNLFERQITDYLRDHLGNHLARPRPGAADDRGDIVGVHGWTLQCKCMGDTLRGINEGLADVSTQCAITQTPFGLAIVKRKRIGDIGRQLAVMELRNAVDVIRATLP